MSDAENIDVLIVGAGPTGMTAALTLQKLGRQVVIIDKHRSGLDFSRAIVINPDSLDILRQFDVTPMIEKRGIVFSGIQIFKGEKCILNSNIAHLAKPHQSADKTVTLPISIAQLETEDCLRQALEKVNIQIERPWALVSLMQDDEGVFATLQSGEDASQIRHIRANYLIGADGFHSVTRQQLGINYQHLSDLPTKMLGVDGIVDNWTFDGHFILRKEGAALAIVFKLQNNSVRYMVTDLALREKIESWLGIKKITWESTFQIHFGTVFEYGRGRVWLAGDAAHVHSPVGGRGMNMGIADGYALGHAIVRGELEAYAQQRHALAKQWVDLNKKITTTVTNQHLWAKLLRSLLFATLELIGKYKADAIGKSLFTKMLGVKLN